MKHHLVITIILKDVYSLDSMRAHSRKASCSAEDVMEGGTFWAVQGDCLLLRWQLTNRASTRTFASLPVDLLVHKL